VSVYDTDIGRSQTRNQPSRRDMYVYAETTKMLANDRPCAAESLTPDTIFQSNPFRLVPSSAS